MADRHIDYHEAVEYGTFCYEQTAGLEGQSSLVNVAAMRARLLERINAVQNEMQRRGRRNIALRGGRGGTGTATGHTVGLMQRLYHHLQSVSPELGCDLDSFFPKGTQFASWRKPADVLARADDALLAFDAEVNANLPDRVTWQGDLILSRTALAQALTGKQGSQLAVSSATSALSEARQAFLQEYNGLTKHLVRLALRELGREHEFRRYFRDLQVNESITTPATPEQPEQPESPEAPELPETPARP